MTFSPFQTQIGGPEAKTCLSGLSPVFPADRGSQVWAQGEAFTNWVTKYACVSQQPNVNGANPGNADLV